MHVTSADDYERDGGKKEEKKRKRRRDNIYIMYIIFIEHHEDGGVFCGTGGSARKLLTAPLQSLCKIRKRKRTYKSF